MAIVFLVILILVAVTIILIIRKRRERQREDVRLQQEILRQEEVYLQEEKLTQSNIEEIVEMTCEIHKDSLLLKTTMYWAELKRGMMAAKKKDDKWWESDRNDFDNDIEQLSRTTGGGCFLKLASVFASLAMIVFLLVI